MVGLIKIECIRLSYLIILPNMYHWVEPVIILTFTVLNASFTVNEA